MYEIPAKVYYKISTGDILVITPEMQNTVEPLTTEEELNTYQQLKNADATDIAFMEIPYGTFVSTFTSNAKSYSVDVANKKLNIVNYTQDELTAIQNQNQEAQNLSNRVSDISQYLQNQTDLISTVENSIIQSELNTVS